MIMANEENEDREQAALAKLEREDDIQRVDMTALAVMNRSEIETAMDFAYRHPRSIRRFISEAETLATLNEEIAASCIYTLPRAGKAIVGPSVRLAEICASTYGNLQVASRVLDAEEREIVAQGVTLDLQQNLRVAIEVKRRITKKDGSRYDDDMISVAGAAAAAIARRNSIFQVVPRAYVDMIYRKARAVAVGDAKTLGHRRAAIFHNFGVLGVLAERVLARIGKSAIDDVTLNDMEVLVGLGTAIRDGSLDIDAAFPSIPGSTPSVPANTEGRRISLVPKAGGKPATPTTPAAADTPPPATDTKASAAVTPPTTPSTPAQPAQEPAKTDAPVIPTADPSSGPKCLVCGKTVPQDRADWVEASNGWKHKDCAPPGTVTAPPAPAASATAPVAATPAADPAAPAAARRRRRNEDPDPEPPFGDKGQEKDREPGQEG
jgi:hypothetical protein